MPSNLFSALGDDVRIQILAMLQRQPQYAGQIVERFDLSGATINHHLGILVKAGLIQCRKDGRRREYSVTRNVRRRQGAMYIQGDYVKVTILPEH